MKQGICPISSFVEWRLLPDVGYEWNEFLLRSIIDIFSDKYRIVEPRITNRRIEKGIIVATDARIDEFVDIVVALMKIAGMERKSERSLLNYLVMRGISIKSLPKELYNTEKLEFNDGYFRIV